MRSALPLVVLAMIAGAAGVEAFQDSDARRPPRNGDDIVVKGCLNGPMLEASEAADADSLLPVGLTFQLKGKKNILKDLVAKHDGQLVEISGVLKSNLDTGATRGRTVGKTRIVVGVQSTNRDQAMMPGMQELQPVLEVKSFESAALNCRR